MEAPRDLVDEFLRAGVVAQQARQLAEERRRKRTVGALAIGLVVVTTLAVAASWFAYQTSRQSRAVLSTALATQAQALADQDRELSLLLAVEAFRQSPIQVAQQALLGALAGSAQVPVVLRGHDDVISTMAFSPDGRWLASGSDDWTTRLWDLAAPRPEVAVPAVLHGIDGSVETVAFSADGRWLAAGNEFGTVSLWERNTADWAAQPYLSRQSLYNGLGSMGSIAFSPDGRHLFTAVNNLTYLRSSGIQPVVNMVDLAASDLTSAITRLPDPPNGPATSLAVSPDNRWLVAGCSREVTQVGDEPASVLCRCRLWDLERAQADPLRLRKRLDTESVVAFSPDGHWLVTTSNRSVYLWDMTTPGSTETELEFRDHRREITTIAISADSRWLVTASNTKAVFPWQRDAAVRVWDLSRSPISPTKVPGHRYTVEAIAISPDSRWLATGGEDSTVQVWDLQDLSSPVATFRDQRAPIRAVAFSPDGRWLASGSDDRSIWLRSDWQGSSASLADLACRTAGRNLTRDEWDTYLVDKDYRQTCKEWPLEDTHDFAWWQFWHWAVWPAIRWVVWAAAGIAISILGYWILFTIVPRLLGISDK